jgi:hypothetical protein
MRSGRFGAALFGYGISKFVAEAHTPRLPKTSLRALKAKQITATSSAGLGDTLSEISSGRNA